MAKRKSKRKVSSEDFMEILEEQEEVREKAAFKPPASRMKKFRQKLSPLQKEWLDLALKNSPQFIHNFLESKETEKFLSKAEDFYTDARTRLNRYIKKDHFKS